MTIGTASAAPPLDGFLPIRIACNHAVNVGTELTWGVVNLHVDAVFSCSPHFCPRRGIMSGFGGTGIFGPVAGHTYQLKTQDWQLTLYIPADGSNDAFIINAFWARRL